MPISYKLDIIAALKEKGYNTNRIRKEKILSESTLQAFRDNKIVSWQIIERLCEMLDCQPGDLVEYVKDNPTGAE